MTDDYEIAVARDEAEDLADKLMEYLPTAALQGARYGTGIAALMIAIRRMISALPEADRQRARENVSFLIAREKWTS